MGRVVKTSECEIGTSLLSRRRDVCESCKCIDLAKPPVLIPSRCGLGISHGRVGTAFIFGATDQKIFDAAGSFIGKVCHLRVIVQHKAD